MEKELGLKKDFRTGDFEDILITMRKLDMSATSDGIQELLRLAQVKPGENAGLSDLIGMVAPLIPTRGSSISRVWKPADKVVGLTCRIDGLVVFYERLNK